MDEKNKSFEKFIEEEMAKSPEQIQKEVMDDPDYPKLVPKPESYEKLKKRIQNYEAEKEAAEKRLLEQLSEKDREALRLGRELQARQKEKPEETAGKVIVYRRRRLRKKPLLAVAATLVLAMGIGMISMGGPRQTLDVAKQMFAGRTRVTINSAEDETYEVKTDAEEEAYQKIKDELGFDPVRMGYLPQGTVFEKGIIDEDAQNIRLYYMCQEIQIFCIIQKQYTEGKTGIDLEDKILKEYPMSIEGNDIQISKYFIKDTKEILYTIEFEYEDTWYCIRAMLKKSEMEKIAKNLIFF